MKKTALTLLSMTLLAAFAYADDSDNSINLVGKTLGARASQQDSEMGVAAGAEMPAILKKDLKKQESDEWVIRSNRENYDTH